MNTRRQDPGLTTFRQEAFASSSEMERGILGNLVAARCHKITDPEEIALLWWLQQVSWRDGGMEKFARDFITANRAQMGTPSMFRFGVAPGQKYSAEQVKAVRTEMGDHSDFPLKGEDSARDRDRAEFLGEDDSEEARRRRQNYPTSYPAAAFVDACSMTAETFAQKLKRALVDPSSEPLRAGFWNFPALWDSLIAWRNAEAATAFAHVVETSVTRQITEELDFALETRSFVLIEGREGVGKSQAASAWCQARPGRAIYIRLEAGTDDTSFFRSFARRIGTACSYGRKAGEIRARVQDAIQPAHLMVVIDEAHFLFSETARSERSMPKRVEWLRTALVDFGVAVALVSTPQHFARQCDRFRKSGWNANQIQRRLTRTVALPEVIETEDAIAIANAYFPTCAQRTVKRAAAAALLSVARLTMFSHLRKRVDFLASRRRGLSESELLTFALDEIGAPCMAAKPEPKPEPSPAVTVRRRDSALEVPARSGNALAVSVP